MNKKLTPSCKTRKTLSFNPYYIDSILVRTRSFPTVRRETVIKQWKLLSLEVLYGNVVEEGSSQVINPKVFTNFTNSYTYGIGTPPTL